MMKTHTFCVGIRFDVLSLQISLVRIQAYIILIFQITMRLVVTLSVLEMERRWQDSFNLHIQNHRKYLNMQ